MDPYRGTQNAATRYASHIDELFYEAEFMSQIIAGRDGAWNWSRDDAASVVFYDMDDVPQTNYSTSGRFRFGDTNEVGNGITSYALTQHKAVEMSVDSINAMNLPANVSMTSILARQIRNVSNPTVDTFSLASIVANTVANSNSKTLALTADNVVPQIINSRKALRNAKVPMNNICTIVSATTMELLFTSANYVFNDSDVAAKQLRAGELGRVVGSKIMELPDSYLPSNTGFITLAKGYCFLPKRIWQANSFDGNQSRGINGMVGNMAEHYDLLIPKNKVDAFYTHKIS